MALLPNADRVRVWNCLFKQAWVEACAVAARSGKKPKGHFTNRLVLSDEEQTCLRLLAYCTLSIEARANHLIDELVEKGRLTELEGGSIQRLSAETKWFLLPKLGGARRRLDRKRPPHQAIVEICAQRNVLFHVNFRRLKDGLPNAGKMLSLFSHFVAAMDDLNVVLKRAKRPRSRVLSLGTFT